MIAVSVCLAILTMPIGLPRQERLYYGIKHHRMGMVRYACFRGASPLADNGYAILNCVIYQNPVALRYLLDKSGTQKRKVTKKAMAFYRDMIKKDSFLLVLEKEDKACLVEFIRRDLMPGEKVALFIPYLLDDPLHIVENLRYEDSEHFIHHVLNHCVNILVHDPLDLMAVAPAWVKPMLVPYAYSR